MKKYWRQILQVVMMAAACSFISACEKEHLQPDVPGNSLQPTVFIGARMGNDSVYFAGGVNSYVGEVAVVDTVINTVVDTMVNTYQAWRYFTFYLYSELSTPAQPKPYFRICINNAQLALGTQQEDLDSSVYTGARVFDFAYFVPLAVTIDWYDSTGAKYSSASFPQSPLNSFNITSVENVTYGNKNYKKVTADFNCLLADIFFSNIIHVTNGKCSVLFGTE